MAQNLATLLISWFWRIWDLLQSLAVFVERKPNLPASVTHPELEKGLYYIPRTALLPHGTGRTKTAVPSRSTSLPFSSTRQGFQINVQQSLESRNNLFLPHPSLRMSSSNTPRRKRSRESTERRRKRRIARVPEFTPPPDIHIEDWSTPALMESPPPSLGKTVSSPPFMVNNPHFVPFVIITPSTPSEEAASASDPDSQSSATLVTLQSDNHLMNPASEASDGNDHFAAELQTPEIVETPGADEIFDNPEIADCQQTARISVHTSDESRTPEVHQKHTFTFSESLTEKAFGQHQSTLHDDNDLTLDLPPSLPILDSAFNPSSNSTLRIDDRDADNDDRNRTSTIFNTATTEIFFADGRDSQRGSALPYPDVFDLDMYADLRASMAVLGINSGDNRRLVSAYSLPSTPTVTPTASTMIRPPTLSKFNFTAPMTPTVSYGLETTGAVGPPSVLTLTAVKSDIQSEVPQERGEYTLSGQFRFPHQATPVPTNETSATALFRQGISSVSSGALDKTRGHHSSWLERVDRATSNEDTPYRDHYRHPAYSRSPPLAFDLSTSRPSSSVSGYPDSSNNCSAVDSQDGSVDKGGMKGKRGASRVPLSRVHLNESFVPLADTAFTTDGDEEEAKDLPRPMSLVRRATSRRKASQRGRGDSENLIPEQATNMGLVRRSNTVRNKLRASRGAVGAIAGSQLGNGKTVNLLKEVNRQEENRRAGMVSFGDVTMDSVYTAASGVRRVH